MLLNAGHINSARRNKSVLVSGDANSLKGSVIMSFMPVAHPIIMSESFLFARICSDGLFGGPPMLTSPPRLPVLANTFNEMVFAALKPGHWAYIITNLFDVVVQSFTCPAILSECSTA